MRILGIGDPHGSSKIKKINFKDVDVIFITGDIGKSDLMRKYAFKHIDNSKSWVYCEKPSLVKKAYLEAFNSTIKILKFLSKKACVYFVYGNVEGDDASTRRLSRKLKIKLPILGDVVKKMKNVYLINNKKIRFKNLDIAGSSFFVEDVWVKIFAPENKKKIKEAKQETKKARKFFSKLKKVDILVCHQPPFGVLDKVNFPSAPKSWQGKHAGSKIILNYIKKKKPKLVLCGHIHEGLGKKKLGKTQVINLGCAGGYSIVDLD